MVPLTTHYRVIEDWDVLHIKHFSSLFSSSRNIDTVSFDHDNSLWNVSAAIDTSKCFGGLGVLMGIYPNGADISNVKDMSNMFGGANAFLGIGLEKWNPECVETMQGLFAGVVVFDANLCRWDVSNVNDMSYMFAARENRSKDDVKKADSLVVYNTSFRGRGLDVWNTSQVKNMKSMFDSA
jgi:Mycoplasma protein of unknown function, DUF285